MPKIPVTDRSAPIAQLARDLPLESVVVAQNGRYETRHIPTHREVMPGVAGIRLMKAVAVRRNSQASTAEA